MAVSERGDTYERHPDQGDLGMCFPVRDTLLKSKGQVKIRYSVRKGLINCLECPETRCNGFWVKVVFSNLGVAQVNSPTPQT